MAEIGTRKPKEVGLDPSDPRSLDHPCHKEQWLELARALGRLDARRDFEALRGGTIDQTHARNSKPRT
jgi:hypothetical protein